MKDIKEVIHLYINSDARYRVKYVDSWEWTVWTKLTEKRYRQLDDKSIEKVEYAVRRLSDMTEEEIKELIGWEKMNAMYTDLRYKLHPGICINIEYSIDAGDEGVYPQFHTISFQTPTIPHFQWLLKKGFDLFDLIDEGAAIDAKTTTP